MNYSILIAPNGFVFAGQYDSLTQELTDAYIVRRWGTTQGLGELALKGPLPNTILDPLPNKTEILVPHIRIPCSDAWTPPSIAAFLVAKSMQLS